MLCFGMEKIKALNIAKKGILKIFVYDANMVRAGEDVAIVTVDNVDIKIKAPYDGLVVKPISEGSIVKKGSVIAYILTDQKKIQKYNRRHKFNESYKTNNLFSKDKWVEINDKDCFGIDNIDDSMNTSKLLDGSSNAVKIKNDFVDDINNNDKAFLNSKYHDLISPFKRCHLLKPLSFKTDKFKEMSNFELNKNNEEIIKNGLTNNLKKTFLTFGGSSKTNLDNMDEKKLDSSSIRTEFIKNDDNNVIDSNQSISNFRSLVNQRREKLYKENITLNCTDNLDKKINNNDSLMNFVDRGKKPRILRNIIQERMYEVMQRNSMDGNNKPSSNASNVNKKVNLLCLRLSKTYSDRLYEKLNNNDQRNKILNMCNQRTLIRERIDKMMYKNVIKFDSKNCDMKKNKNINYLVSDSISKDIKKDINLTNSFNFLQKINNNYELQINLEKFKDLTKVNSNNKFIVDNFNKRSDFFLIKEIIKLNSKILKWKNSNNDTNILVGNNFKLNINNDLNNKYTSFQNFSNSGLSENKYMLIRLMQHVIKLIDLISVISDYFLIKINKLLV